jgi:hypothetical protein
MQQPPATIEPSPIYPPAPKGHRLRTTVIAIVGGLVILLVGVGIGSASNSLTGQLNIAKAQLKTGNGKLATADRNLASAQSQITTLKGQYSAAKTAASQAASVATAKASAAYAARNASLDQRAKSLDAKARAIAATEGELQANTISSDGVYVVGQDIKSGTWHTNGDGGSGDQCYYATLNSTDTSDISDNNNFDGPDLSGVYALQISGPCTWVRIG